VRLLQDVYFLEWDIQPPADLKQQQKIGFIESSKAESDLYAPVTGVFSQINEDLLSDPSAINTDKYDAGWLFAMEAGEEQLLTPERYIAHLEAVWETTQRTIKGQMNE
jgi:glycine cleavage system H protein